jgi:hypothetical protein
MALFLMATYLLMLGGIPNKVQVGDMGIDGRIYPVGISPRMWRSRSL